MSDTHSLTSHIKNPIPDGDVFVHAGDFTRTGKLSEVREFNAWIAQVEQGDTLDTDTGDMSACGAVMSVIHGMCIIPSAISRRIKY